MKRPIGRGVSDFKELVEEGYLYVDKTLLIEELSLTNGKVLCITRPHLVSVKPLICQCFSTFMKSVMLICLSTLLFGIMSGVELCNMYGDLPLVGCYHRV